MADMRKLKKQIAEAIEKVNETANCKWKSKIFKSEIWLTNEYIKGQFERDSFRIRVDESEEYVMGYDCLGENYTTLIVGDDRWSDGSLLDCITKAIKNSEKYFEQCY